MLSTPLCVAVQCRNSVVCCNDATKWSQNRPEWSILRVICTQQHAKHTTELGISTPKMPEKTPETPSTPVFAKMSGAALSSTPQHASARLSTPKTPRNSKLPKKRFWVSPARQHAKHASFRKTKKSDNVRPGAQRRRIASYGFMPAGPVVSDHGRHDQPAASRCRVCDIRR